MNQTQVKIIFGIDVSKNKLDIWNHANAASTR